MSSSSTYRTPVFIGLVCVMCFAMVLLLHHCVIILCCNSGNRRRRRHHHHNHQQEEQEEPEEDEREGSSSRVHLVKGAAAIPAVVSPYRKEDSWSESTCPVCLADFADGEPVRVLPECMHYFHAECIDTWLRGGSTSCPMCRAETTPTPSPAHLNHHNLSVSVSLEEILVRT